MAKHLQIANSFMVSCFGIISYIVILLFLLSCATQQPQRMDDFIMNEKPMPAIGTVALSRLDENADTQLYRKFLRLLTKEAPAEPFDGRDVTRFAIKSYDSERWMVVIFKSGGATYKIEGQLLSPDILSKEDEDKELYFLGRIAYSSLSYDGRPLDLKNSSEAFELVAPLIQSLGRRVCGMLRLPEAAG